MPGFDRTGPNGSGPMTGRVMGPCGRGYQRGRGMGRGMRRFSPYTAPCYAQDEEIDVLKKEAKYLKSDLDAVNKRIEELKKEGKK